MSTFAQTIIPIATDEVSITEPNGVKAFTGNKTLNSFGGSTLLNKVNEAQIVRVNVRRDTQVFIFPLETSELVTESRIIQPIMIDVIVYIVDDPLKIIYQKMDQIFKSAESLTIGCKQGFFTNMFLKTLPGLETTDKNDAIELQLVFQEILVGASKSFSPENPNNSDTTSIGVQTLSNLVS